MLMTIHCFIYIFSLSLSSRHLSINRPDRLIITTTGKGHRLDKIEDERLQPTRADLLVYFDAASLFLVYRYLTLITTSFYCYFFCCYFLSLVIKQRTIKTDANKTTSNATNIRRSR